MQRRHRLSKALCFCKISVCIFCKTEDSFFSQSSIPLLLNIPPLEIIQLSCVKLLGTLCSRHHGRPIKAPLKPLEHHNNIVPRGLECALNSASIITADEQNSSLASREKSLSEYLQIRSNLDCNYIFPIDLASKGIKGFFLENDMQTPILHPKVGKS